MRLLVLGGTEFVGRAVVEEALARGAEVTVLHRGQHPAPPGVTVLHGDRRVANGLEALGTSEWDTVVDTWSGAPVAVRDAAAMLAGRVGRYAYVSSRSVYTWPAPAGMNESAALVDGNPDSEDEAAYAEAKRGGELAAEAVFGDRTLLVRAGLILGPYENIGRLPWWLSRIARGGEVPAPGPADLNLQYIDARDLARWTMNALERGLGGAYNVVSPSGHTTMGELLDTCRRVTGGETTLRWLEPEAIAAAGVQPWTELPIWLPPGEYHDAMHRGDVSKALGAGLVCRPVAETVADTWAWLRSIGGVPPQRSDRPTSGLSVEAEGRLLAA